jgi:ribosomal protein L5
MEAPKLENIVVNIGVGDEQHLIVKMFRSCYGRFRK